jgi:hypothetical protein
MTALKRAVRNDTIQFATMRPPDSPFALLQRRVVVTAPPELVALLAAGSCGVLEELVEILDDPDRSWAAEVALAAVTQREQDLVNSYAGTPEKWPSSRVGRTARERWSAWLQATKSNLSWDPESKVFSERP